MFTDRPGVDHAVATAAQVLHAAAWLDFRTHIGALVQAGQLREAFRCWVSVVEVTHAPWQSPSLGEFDELPPLRRAACGEFPCDRCATRRGGFKFPGLVRGPLEVCWCPMVLTRCKPGLITKGTRRSWTSFSWPCAPPPWRQTMCALRRCMDCSCDRRSTLTALGWRTPWRSSRTGKFGLGLLEDLRPLRDGPLRSCSHLLPGGDPGQCGDLVPTEHTEPWWAGWVPSELAENRPCWLALVPDVATLPGGHASSAELACAVSAMVPGTSVRAGQAPVAEPVLIPVLEDRVKELHELGDERWSALLAPWLICFGMVRYAHVMRTEPIKLTGAFLHCRCSRGKQHQHRAGFDYAIPGSFLNGFAWSRELMELYRTLVPAKQKSCGLCFSDEGKPWSINEIQQTMR
eukprot:Skav207721  [mRNA]  locus=scaffold1347:166075:168834:+ [translate_table: standard]